MADDGLSAEREPGACATAAERELVIPEVVKRLVEPADLSKERSSNEEVSGQRDAASDRSLLVHERVHIQKGPERRRVGHGGAYETPDEFCGFQRRDPGFEPFGLWQAIGVAEGESGRAGKLCGAVPCGIGAEL